MIITTDLGDTRVTVEMEAGGGLVAQWSGKSFNEFARFEVVLGKIVRATGRHVNRGQGWLPVADEFRVHGDDHPADEEMASLLEAVGAALDRDVVFADYGPGLQAEAYRRETDKLRRRRRVLRAQAAELDTEIRDREMAGPG